MYRDGTLEELIKDLEEERASKRLRELDPELLIKPDIWIVTPEEGACEKCKSFAKKLFFEKPQRPHPNCKCKIQRILPKKTAQKALIKNTPIVTDLLRGDTSPLFLFFSATSVINVHIKNLNPVRCADVNIDSYNELGKESKSSYLLPLSSVVFMFSYFRDDSVDWNLVLVTNFDDAQLLCTVKNTE